MLPASLVFSEELPYLSSLQLYDMHSASTKPARACSPTPSDVSLPNALLHRQRPRLEGSVVIKTNVSVSDTGVPEKQQPPRSPVKRALLIGINGASNDNGALGFCCRDALNLRSCLIRHYGYSTNDITMMLDHSSDTDPSPTYYPSKQNILFQISKLTSGVQPGDQLVFYYSGHGLQSEQGEGDEMEEDGKDEAISTADGDNILDNVLYDQLVKPLVPGCRLTAIIDSCFSGTMLDLPHRRCNRSWFPWVARGVRRTCSVYQHVVRKNDGVFSAGSRNSRRSRSQTDPSYKVVNSSKPAAKSSCVRIISERGPVGSVKKRSGSLRISTFEDGNLCQHKAEDVSDIQAKTKIDYNNLKGQKEASKTSGMSFLSDGPSSLVDEPLSFPKISSCPKGDVPAADTITIPHLSAGGTHVHAAAPPLSQFLSDDGAYCQSPTAIYTCSGWNCPPVKAEEQTVICISASREGQRAIEDARNQRTMTSILLKHIEDDMSSPYPSKKSLRELVKLVSHDIYEIYLTLYKRLWKYRCKNRKLLKHQPHRQRRRATIGGGEESKSSPDEPKVNPPTRRKDSRLVWLEEESGQDLEISSKGPLGPMLDEPLAL